MTEPGVHRPSPGRECRTEERRQLLDAMPVGADFLEGQPNGHIQRVPSALAGYPRRKPLLTVQHAERLVNINELRLDFDDE